MLFPLFRDYGEGVKLSGSSRTEIQNEWRFTSSPAYASIACTRITLPYIYECIITLFRVAFRAHVARFHFAILLSDKDRFQWPSRLRCPITHWDCGFESRRGDGYLSLVSVVLSGRGLCDGPITRPEESYRLWSVSECVLETWRMRRPWTALGCCTRQRK